MGWNIVLDKFKEIRDRAASTGKDLWAYDRQKETCLEYWVSVLNDGPYKERCLELLRYLELDEHEDFLLLRYGNYSDVFSGEDEKVTFDSFWDLEGGFYRECRSVVIDIRRAELVLTPFRQFRNLNESEETSYEEVAERIRRASCVEFSNKLDGSMQCARFYRDRIVMAGSQALDRTNSWRLADGYRMLCEKPGYEKMLREHPDKTFIFEYISHKDAHVVKYDQEGLFLIGIRDVGTGKEADYREVLEYASRYDLPTTELFDKTLDQVVSELDLRKSSEAEGFVLNVDGFKVKIKYNDYVYMHKVLSALSSVNLIIQNIAEDRFDDFIAKIPKAYHDRVFKVARVVGEYAKTQNELVEKAYLAAPKGDQKEFMVWVNENVDRKLQGYVRNRYLGREVNVLKRRNGYIKLKEMGVEDYSRFFKEEE